VDEFLAAVNHRMLQVCIPWRPHRDNRPNVVWRFALRPFQFAPKRAKISVCNLTPPTTEEREMRNGGNRDLKN